MLRYVLENVRNVFHLLQTPNDFICNFEGSQYNQLQSTTVLYKHYLIIRRDIY
jgi:hypothetical protein